MGPAREEPEIGGRLAGLKVPERSDWYVMSRGHTMVVIRGPVEFRTNAIEARKMSLGNWYRKKHRWDVPMGESLANFSLGMESQRWHIILHWKSVIA